MTDSAPAGQRLAPVTYLFGAGAATAGDLPDEDDIPIGPAVTEVAYSGPAFRDESGSQDEPDSEPEPYERPARKSQAERKKERDAFAPINNISMNALGRKGMSSREMHDFLKSKDFLEADVAEEVERLERVGLLDDIALAETLTRTLRERKGLGRSALTAELRRRKLDPVAIEETASSLGDDELERAVEMAVKRAPQLRSLDSETAKRRLSAFLMRKGYSGSVISAAVAKALTPSGGPSFR